MNRRVGHVAQMEENRNVCVCVCVFGERERDRLEDLAVDETAILKLTSKKYDGRVCNGYI